MSLSLWTKKIDARHLLLVRATALSRLNTSQPFYFRSNLRLLAGFPFVPTWMQGTRVTEGTIHFLRHRLETVVYCSYAFAEREDCYSNHQNGMIDWSWIHQQGLSKMVHCYHHTCSAFVDLCYYLSDSRENVSGYWNAFSKRPIWIIPLAPE